ncbi:MAG: UPF0489 family protein [Nanoarchaeota archaeon]|nr:UPF0489 family protein [Nanoarchaeota archaeon]
MNSDIIDLMMEDVLHLEEITYFDKLYYVFDRHRTSFLCWAKALKERAIQKDNLLITIDKHCDFFIEDLKKEHIELAKSLDINRIRNNIKENNKQDFIVMGMETGIIKDVVIISPLINKAEFPNGLPENYKDTKGNIHKAFYFKEIKDFEANFKEKIGQNALLDIDLDYFQTHTKNIDDPIEKWKYTKKSTKEERRSLFKPGTKLNNVFKNVKAITLAEEMRYSQGKGRQWAREFIDLFFSLEEFNHGGDNPFNLEEEDVEYSE